MRVRQSQSDKYVECSGSCSECGWVRCLRSKRSDAVDDGGGSSARMMSFDSRGALPKSSSSAASQSSSKVMWCASVHEVAPNSADAAAGKVSRRRQPNFCRAAPARQPDLVSASRKSGGGAAWSTIMQTWVNDATAVTPAVIFSKMSLIC